MFKGRKISLLLTFLFLLWPSLCPASSTQFQGFQRYEVHGSSWQDMLDGKAYFRDAFVGALTWISEAMDGETWGGSVVRPDLTFLYWNPITFHANYQGKTDCFTCPGWREPVCGSRSIVIRWLTDVQCWPTGLWTFHLWNNNTEFATPQFTLLPQIPPFPALSQSGNSTPYDNICKGPLDKRGRRQCVPCGDSYQEPYTIGQKGCALVCAVMVLRYHGVTEGIDGRPVTAENLNAWLIAEGDGYRPKGDINWDKLRRYSAGKVTFRGITSKTQAGYLTNEICSHGPTIIQVDSPGYPERGRLKGHFVLATGRDYPAQSTWLINDPAGGQQTTLAAKYHNRYYGLRMFTGPEFTWTDELSGLTIVLYSPAELLLTDPQGRKTGFDPLTNTQYEEIPQSGYLDCSVCDPETGEPTPPIMELDIREPSEGSYTLQVIGTEVGTYGLYLRPQDRSGESAAQLLLSEIPISPGAIHQYQFEYSSVPGSLLKVGGNFDGKGQRPSDVNKFLSYANPLQARVQLPAGENSFPLLIFYGSTILPQTFQARLNGVDIGSLFHPVPGGTELVNLTLTSGSNSLLLSIQGTSASGRVATDTDRLTFIVP